MRKSLKTISLQNKIQIIMPKDFTEKVEYLCASNPKDEWSGVLFYEVKGNIKKPSSMKLICKDILLMDIGNATFTSYNFDKELIPYYKKHPKMLGCRYGQIHSHNTMTTFFSGTDVEDLEDNAPNHNFYLSLIVNNYLSTTAKVAFMGSSPKLENRFECLDENGDSYYLKSTIEPQEIMFIYDCEVEVKGRVININQELQERLKLIKDRKIEAAKAKTAQQQTNTKNYNGGHQQNKDYGGGSNYYGKQNGNNHHVKGFQEHNKQHDFNFKGVEVEEVEEVIEEVDAVIEQFTCFCLRGSNELKGDSIDQALEDMDESGITDKSTEYIQAFIENYPAYFEKFFDDFGKTNVESFSENTQEVINLLEDYCTLYPVIEKIKKSLELMLTELNKIV